MPFWSGDTLIREIPRQRIISPYNSTQIDCAAYRLRMGREAFITPDYQVKRLSEHKKIWLKENEDFPIPSGQFAFLLTEEIIQIPDDVLGFISLRTAYKFRGLINVSGFHVDPGFKGHLVYAVYNAGPRQIYLKRGMELFLIWFATLDQTSGKYTWNRPPLSEINPDMVTEISEEILSLQSLSREMKELRDRWNNLILIGKLLLALVPILALGITVIRFWDSIKAFLSG